MFFSKKHKIKFNPETLIKTRQWVNEQASNIIFIYGNLDTPSASAILPNSNTNCEWFFLKDKNHRTARFKEMTNEEQKRFLHITKKWLNISLRDI